MNEVIGHVMLAIGIYIHDNYILQIAEEPLCQSTLMTLWSVWEISLAFLLEM